AEIGFNIEAASSPRFGYLPTMTPGLFVEVFRDWVIFGNQAHDVDASTSGHVHVDGSIQVSSGVDSRGRAVQYQHDTRRAEIQFVSAHGTLSAPIHPDSVMEAKKLIAQLEAHVSSLKPR